MANETPSQSDPRDRAIDELRADAQAQELSYSRGQPTDDTAGLELFRRAIDERNDDAWRAIMEIYRGLLVAQAGRRVIRGLVIEDDGFCVDRAFQRFWRATRSARVHHQFNDLASILKYLKLCLGTVLLDEARARRRQGAVSIDDVPTDRYVSADASTDVIGKIARRELWRAIERELADANQRLVARLSFLAGLSPREILARHPDTFQDVFDVYRTKRNMLDRLRRSRAIQDLME